MNDVIFLLREEDLFTNTTKQSNDESKSTQDLTSENRVDSWYGIEPWLRLRHCMLEEEVLEAHVSMQNGKKEKAYMVVIMYYEEKLFLGLVQTNSMTKPLNHIHFVTLICMMISLLAFHCLIMKIVLYL